MRRAARRLLLGIAALAAVSPCAGADELAFPAGTLDRGSEIAATYRLDRPATGRGALHLEWTDAHGRLVERRATPVALDGATAIPIPLDLTRAVATENRLRVRLSLEGEAERELDAFVLVPPSDPGWSDYQVIMWQHQDARGYGALKDLGVSAGMAYATRDESLNEEMVGPLLGADLRWYVENIATDFFSTYHRWHPDRPKNWRFLEVKELYRRDPHDPRALERDPSLSDPAWLAEIRERLAWTVRTYAPYRPLFYNLADEPGIAETAAFWDFDLSAHSLRGMRAWLEEQYGDLAALNRQWGSSFARWDEVVPMTTREAVQRRDENFSAWADFKAWMDVAFARAVRTGTDAIHAADPAARSALEGLQIPGWGGYDYARLAGTVDVMEIYDYGENVEIVRSLDPALIILATSGGSGAREAHVVWRDLLRGSRGVIFWDDEREVVGPDGKVGDRGRQAADWIGKIRGGLGALLIGSSRHFDPIAMLYSPASQRTQWMLDVKPHGQAWSERDVDDEYQDNAIRLSSRRFRWAVEHMGLQHRMVSPEQIEEGVLEALGIRVLILPHAVSLSAAEAERIRRFAGSGGIVVADGEPGRFDEHSRRLDRPLLAGLFRDDAAGRAIRLPASELRGIETMERLRPILAAAGIAPRYVVTAPGGRPVTDVETYVFRNGGTTLLAFQRTPAALGESGRAGEPQPLVVSLPAPSHVYDVLGRTSLGRLDRVEIALDGVEPTFLTLADSPVPAPGISAPARLRPGETGLLRIARPEGSSAGLHVLHVAVERPDGQPVPHYSGNVILRGDNAAFPLPLALNDETGRWTVRVSDAATGQVVAATIEVAAD